jgi:hydrogenase expression/formation protein HypD
MKFVDEYRDRQKAEEYAGAIASITTQPWTIMEVCGGQTHSIVKYGLDQLLPEGIKLIHGPGCPVCVTSIEVIDQAIHLAGQPDIIFCSFGDMLRVPGAEKDLLSVKASGGDIHIIYSPLDALKIAQENPTKEVIFFAVGFETTAPATAMTVCRAQQENIDNFSLLVSHVLVPPAINFLLSSPHCQIQGFLAAGHVCTVMGYQEYEPIVDKYKVPIVVTGFEPIDILQGIYLCIEQLETGESECQNQYTRSVRPRGNPIAQKQIQEVFIVVDRDWRGIGIIPHSGLSLNDSYAKFDAQKKFSDRLNHTLYKSEQNSQCISGEIMLGTKKPHQCSAFGNQCTPEHPLGAPMVSSEGACAAYYRYRSQLIIDN